MTRIALVASSGPVTSRGRLVNSLLVSCLVGRLIERTSLQAIDGLVFTLGLVVLGHDGRDASHVSKVNIQPIQQEPYEQQALLTPDMFADEQ